MANNTIDLKFITDTTQLDKAITKSNQIEAGIRKLAKAEAAGKITTDQYTKAVNSHAASLQKATGNNIAARNAVFSYSRSVIQANKSVNTSTQQLNTNTVAVRSNAAAAELLANRQRMAGKTTNRFGMYSQQVGYQVGDFFVQVQSGTDALVAFGQQGTQLAGLLPGLAGAILGIGLALGTALGRMTLQAKGIAFDFRKMGADIMGALEPISPILDAVGSTLSSMRGLFAGFGKALLNNLDRIIAALLTASALFATRFVAGIIAARVATMTLAGSLLFLRGALIRTGIGALIVGAGELVYQFTRLVKGAGGFGNALGLLFDVAKEVWDGIVNYMGIIPVGLQVIGEEMKKAWNEVLRWMAKKFTDFARMTFEPLNKMSIAAGGEELVDLLYLESWASSFDAAVIRSEKSIAALKDQVQVIKNTAFNGLSAALDALVMAVAKAESTGGDIDPSTWFMPDDGDDDKGKGKGESALAQLLEEQRQRKILLDLTGQERMLKEEIFAVTKQLGDEAKLLSDKQIEALAKVNLGLTTQEELYQKLVEKVQGVAGTIQSSMENAFMSIVDGTSSAKDAFKNMAREVIKELYKVLVVQQLVGSFDRAAGTGSGIVGAIGKALFPNANGNAFFGGRVTPFANGGVVNGPTMFPMSGGQTGLMGEAGPEAIMPLKRDKNGRLGVSVDGGSGAVNVVNNINVTGGSDPAAIRMEVAKLMPQITNATKAAVIDARRRGGQMKASFG